jgi:hypothetical protein
VKIGFGSEGTHTRSCCHYSCRKIEEKTRLLHEEEKKIKETKGEQDLTKRNKELEQTQNNTKKNMNKTSRLLVTAGKRLHWKRQMCSANILQTIWSNIDFRKASLHKTNWIKI